VTASFPPSDSEEDIIITGKVELETVRNKARTIVTEVTAVVEDFNIHGRVYPSSKFGSRNISIMTPVHENYRTYQRYLDFRSTSSSSSRALPSKVDIANDKIIWRNVETSLIERPTLSLNTTEDYSPLQLIHCPVDLTAEEDTLPLSENSKVMDVSPEPPLTLPVLVLFVAGSVLSMYWSQYATPVRELPLRADLSSVVTYCYLYMLG
jgi:hypothetical protein